MTPTPSDPSDRPSSPHRVSCPELSAQSEGPISVWGPEAHHALRVKRLRTGDAVELFDGRGGARLTVLKSSYGSKQNPTIVLDPSEEFRCEPPPEPRVVVCCPPPKPDRVGPMIDQLGQVGAAAWIPMVTARTQGKSMAFNQDKLERVVVESSKQCGRAWLLEIEDPMTFEQALAEPGAVVFDASGSRIPISPTDGETHLLVGPEGGWTPGEMSSARAAGAPIVRLGMHVMRLETAAVAAAIMGCTTGS